MNGPIRDVDAQRGRWAAYRQEQGLVLGAADDFALGGLGRHAIDLDIRMLFLPADPHADAVSLSSDSLSWLREERESPYGGGQVLWGREARATSGALVLYNQYGDGGGWSRYLALHRHGGLELASGRCSYEMRDVRIFHLRHIVGLIWSALAFQGEVISRWEIDAPFELTVSLRKTMGATLGGFAEGWREPGRDLFEFPTCIEDHVLLRWELDKGFDAGEVALNVGDRVEQSFGTTGRRHLAHRGEYKGRFDPQFAL